MRQIFFPNTIKHMKSQFLEVELSDLNPLVVSSNNDRPFHIIVNLINAANQQRVPPIDLQFEKRQADHPSYAIVPESHRAQTYFRTW